MLSSSSLLLASLLAVSSFTSSAFASPVFKQDLQPRQDPTTPSPPSRFACGNGGKYHSDALKSEEEELTSALADRAKGVEKRTNSHLDPQDLLDFSKTFVTKVVPIHFHVIYANKTVEGGYLTEDSITKQMIVMNDAYSATGIQFILKSAKYTKNKVWFEKATLDDATEEGNIYAKQMKHALAIKGANNLNVYTVGNPPSADGNVLFGYAQFPWLIKKDPESDGVVIQHWTLPDPGVYMQGGEFSAGVTLVHEMGHAFGLYHTFNQPDGCNEKDGDQVKDTPTESDDAWPSVADPMIGRDTCPGQPGLDPINNYMEYAPDAFSTTFSAGQSARMIYYTELYRGI